MQRLVIFLLAIITVSCSKPTDNPEKTLFLGQGIMVGEVTDQNAIIQTRLTATDTLINGELPGKKGWVQFVLSLDPQLQKALLYTNWIFADSTTDFIVKTKVKGLQPHQKYHYQALYGIDTLQFQISPKGSFKTNPGATVSTALSFVVATGMNFYFFQFGKYDAESRYLGNDKHLGYPALASIKNLAPDYFIGTGDNVYFDHPAEKNFQNALKAGKNPLPGYFNGKAVLTEAGMRRKYHVQFVQPRFIDLFRETATYWEKDDHDYRVNDSDPFMDFPVTHEMGIKNFKEQLPVTDPKDKTATTYRTHRLSKDLQLWFVEGRDYRSANKMPDGPKKSIWGAKQKEWLKTTLLASDATFKLLISPTPMVGPDDAHKRDNHVNLQGFRHEGDEFFNWLTQNNFLHKNFYILCGDRHWQYHAVHPNGFEEFSCGSLVEANSRAGRLAGDHNSTDPEGKIKQLYVQGTAEEASAGFLLVNLVTSSEKPMMTFSFYDEMGQKQYEVVKMTKK